MNIESFFQNISAVIFEWGEKLLQLVVAHPPSIWVLAAALFFPRIEEKRGELSFNYNYSGPMEALRKIIFRIVVFKALVVPFLTSSWPWAKAFFTEWPTLHALFLEWPATVAFFTEWPTIKMIMEDYYWFGLFVTVSFFQLLIYAIKVSRVRKKRKEAEGD